MTINGALGGICYAYKAPAVLFQNGSKPFFDILETDLNLSQNDVAELSCTITTQLPCQWRYDLRAGDITWLGPSSGQFTPKGSNTHTIKTLLKANSAGLVRIWMNIMPYGNSNSMNVSAGLLLMRVIGRQA